MAEAAQQAAGALPTQEVEADAPFLAVDLYSMGCLLSELHWALQYAPDQLRCCRCECTTGTYLHDVCQVVRVLA